MYFKTLKERMEYYKSLTDYRLMPNSYVICHVDGKNFSKKVKKFFKLPFDDKFLLMMNEAAKYACKNIQGCKMAYVQSDEITFIITDFEKEQSDSYYSYRLCKMQARISSFVTSKFQQLFCANYPDRVLDDRYLFQFDCKCFVVPEYNDVFAWLKYRQNDCIRNSKNQVARTYCTHKELTNKTSDEQIKYLKEKKGIDWNNFCDSEKYGRIIYKELETHSDYDEQIHAENLYQRSVWSAHPAVVFNREWFDNISLVPQKIK